MGGPASLTARTGARTGQVLSERGVVCTQVLGHATVPTVGRVAGSVRSARTGVPDTCRRKRSWSWLAVVESRVQMRGSEATIRRLATCSSGNIGEALHPGTASTRCLCSHVKDSEAQNGVFSRAWIGSRFRRGRSPRDGRDERAALVYPGLERRRLRDWTPRSAREAHRPPTSTESRGESAPRPCPPNRRRAMLPGASTEKPAQAPLPGGAGLSTSRDRHLACH